MSAGTAVRRAGLGQAAIRVFAAAFLIIALYQFAGLCESWLRVLAFRYKLDYGEGIVWQQALLMFGPRMYSPSTALPFVVFHYPPLYHFAVRALMAFDLDPLLAGRLVSIAASLVIAVSIGVLVLMGTPGRRRPEHVALAAAIALMAVCLHPLVRWGFIMRVDALAVALGLAGTVVFVRSRGTTTGMTFALLICVAAMFTKQTMIPAGLSVIVVAMLHSPRRAIVASLIAGGVGLAALAVLEITTGGFLRNIVGYNVNPLEFSHALVLILYERENAPLVLLMLAGALKVAFAVRDGRFLGNLHRFDPATVTRAVVVMHFAVACLTVLQIVKMGSSTNYFIDMLASGSIVAGFIVCEVGGSTALVCTAIVIMALTTAKLRHEHLDPEWAAVQTTEMTRLTELIAAQTKPVISDDMVLLLRAGKSVVYEPAIVLALIAGHQWDPSALLAAIRDREFAFVLTDGEPIWPGSPLTAAIAAAYPRRVTTPVELVINYPP